jgi:hypothetical protein
MHCDECQRLPGSRRTWNASSAGQTEHPPRAVILIGLPVRIGTRAALLEVPHEVVSELPIEPPAQLPHDRRRVVHMNVTAHSTAAWTAQQLREARPWDSAPRFGIRDRDGIYGPDVQATMRAMGIEEVVIAPRPPHRVERALIAPPPPAVPRLVLLR